MAIARSQFVTATGASVSSLSAVFSSAVSSGNLILVWGSYFNLGTATFSTVTDNVNNAGFTARMLSTMSNASDTNVHLLLHEKLNISSGAAASTYRISYNLTASGNPTFYAVEYSGGPFT